MTDGTDAPEDGPHPATTDRSHGVTDPRRVAIVSVGDELLAGETVNTNAAWLGRRLTERGLTVGRTVVLPDDEEAIAATVARLADRTDAVLVTGGLGPTHDDRTMAAVARAFDRELGHHPDAAAHIEARGDYAVADLTEGTTHLPSGARALPNDVGVAPGAVVENVYVLPGVPAEMEAMFEHVAGEFEAGGSHVAEVGTSEPESALLDRLATLRERFDVSVGSYPGEMVTVRIRAAERSEVRAAAGWLADRVEDGQR